jgi:hypothetical protein
LCINQQHQIALVANMFAGDNDGFLFSGKRDFSATAEEHTIWLHRDTMFDLRDDYMLLYDFWYCPNMRPFDQGGGNGDSGTKRRIGFGYMGGHPRLISQHGLKLPLRIDEDGALPLVADINDHSKAGGNKWSGWAHAKYGGSEQRRFEYNGADPFALGAQGGHVILLDGSCRWYRYYDLTEYPAAGNANYVGRWVNSD